MTDRTGGVESRAKVETVTGKHFPLKQDEKQVVTRFKGR